MSKEGKEFKCPIFGNNKFFAAPLEPIAREKVMMWGGKRIRFTSKSKISKKQQFNELQNEWWNLYDPWIACKCGFASNYMDDFLQY